MPVDDIAATWASVSTAEDETVGDKTQQSANRRKERLRLNTAAGMTTTNNPVMRPPEAFPTALADGLATALFVTQAGRLRDHFPFECAVVRADRTAAVSRRFPGRLFVS